MALSMTTNAARAAQAKAAKLCEEAKGESSLAVIARWILEDFDTSPQGLEYLCLRTAFRMSHGSKAWDAVNDIVREFGCQRR